MAHAKKRQEVAGGTMGNHESISDSGEEDEDDEDEEEQGQHTFQLQTST